MSDFTDGDLQSVFDGNRALDFLADGTDQRLTLGLGLHVSIRARVADGESHLVGNRLQQVRVFLF